MISDLEGGGGATRPHNLTTSSGWPSHHGKIVPHPKCSANVVPHAVFPDGQEIPFLTPDPTVKKVELAADGKALITFWNGQTVQGKFVHVGDPYRRKCSVWHDLILVKEGADDLRVGSFRCVRCFIDADMRFPDGATAAELKSPRRAFTCPEHKGDGIGRNRVGGLWSLCWQQPKWIRFQVPCHTRAENPSAGGIAA